METIFFLNTSINLFALWLQEATKNVEFREFPTERGRIGLNSAKLKGRSDEAVVLSLDGAYIYPTGPTEETACFLDDVILLKLLPLTKERIEVQAKCTQPVVESYFRELITKITKRWPEVSVIDTKYDGATEIEKQYIVVSPVLLGRYLQDEFISAEQAGPQVEQLVRIGALREIKAEGNSPPKAIAIATFVLRTTIDLFAQWMAIITGSVAILPSYFHPDMGWHEFPAGNGKISVSRASNKSFQSKLCTFCWGGWWSKGRYLRRCSGSD